jgi:MFS family permease
MDPLKELLDEAKVEAAIRALVVVGPACGLALGGLWAALGRGAWRVGLGRGLAVGLLGPLVWLLWRLYSHLVRFAPAADPKDDYFGLERVDVLLLNVVIFTSVGALVGWLIGRVRARDRAAANRYQAETETDHA